MASILFSVAGTDSPGSRLAPPIQTALSSRQGSNTQRTPSLTVFGGENQQTACCTSPLTSQSPPFRKSGAVLTRRRPNPPLLKQGKVQFRSIVPSGSFAQHCGSSPAAKLPAESQSSRHSGSPSQQRWASSMMPHRLFQRARRSRARTSPTAHTRTTAAADPAPQGAGTRLTPPVASLAAGSVASRHPSSAVVPMTKTGTTTTRRATTALADHSSAVTTIRNTPPADQASSASGVAAAAGARRLITSAPHGPTSCRA